MKYKINKNLQTIEEYNEKAILINVYIDTKWNREFLQIKLKRGLKE